MMKSIMKEVLKTIWYFLCKNVFILISDRSFTQITAFLTYKRLGFKFRRYNLTNPESFNEKLNYLKLNPENKTYSKYADKIAVRDFVKETVGAKYLIPVIGIFKTAEEINFRELPDKFVLKANHGSGWNIICEDKQSLNFEKTRRKLKKWLKYNSFYLSREYQYKPIVPAIICEELLEFNIFDYKFFCFSGNPEIIQVDIDRFTNHRRAFYNVNWEKQDFSIRYPISDKIIEKPAQFDEMFEVCKKLSAPFNFVRVDLYLHNSKIYFGELTFFPGGGNEPFNPVESDYSFGRLLNL
jgi:hypothetical protein